MGKGLGKFANDIPPELVVVLWTKMIAPGHDNLEHVNIVHHNMVSRVMEIFEDEDSAKKVMDAQKAREEAEAKKKQEKEEAEAKKASKKKAK